MVDLLNDIKKKGIRVNNYRLLHSNGMSDKKTAQKIEVFKKNNDILSEKNLFTKFLIEKTEILLTKQIIILSLAHLTMICNSLFLLYYVVLYNVDIIGFNNVNYIIYSIYIISLVLFMIGHKYTRLIIMNNSSIDMSNSIYNYDIKQKKTV